MEKPKLFFQFDGGQIAYDGDKFVGILDIPEGSSFTDAFALFVEKFAKVNNLPQSDNCEPYTKNPAAIKASEIITDIPTTSTMRKSSCYQQIGVTRFSYSVESQVNQISIFYDLNSVLKSIPNTFQVAGVNVIIYGKVNSRTGRSIINQSTSNSRGVVVPAEQFPLALNVNIRLDTPCGSIVMRKEVYVNQPNGNYTALLEIVDASQNQTSELMQEDFNKMVDTAIKDINSVLDQRSAVQISDGSFAKYPSSDPLVVIAQQAGYIEQLYGRVQALENQDTTGGLESEITALKTSISNLEKEIASLKVVDKDLDTRIRQNEAVIMRIDEGI